MKILFDENFPKLIRSELKEFTVFTTGELGWNGIKNGKLLKLMVENKFDCLLTLDKNLEYQQNLQNLPVKILVVNTFDTTYKNILKLVPKIIYTLKNLTSDKIYTITE